MKLGLRWTLLLMLACPLATAASMRVCVDELSHLPFITPKGEGVSGKLISQAAQEAGIAIIFYSAPITRCREEIRAGLADGFPTAPYTPALLPFMAFPMQQSKPDPARAVVVARGLIFRRTGSDVDWDGQRFINLKRPAMLPFGSVLLTDRLRAMHVRYDDKGKSMKAQFAKLLAERGDVVIGAEYSGRAALSDVRYTGKIEELAKPFSEEPYYFGISRKFYEANGAQVEQLWDAIGRIRASPAYRENYQKAMLAAARAGKE